MSALGQKRTLHAKRHVRFTPKSGHSLLRANVRFDDVLLSEPMAPRHLTALGRPAQHVLLELQSIMRQVAGLEKECCF